MSGQSGERGRRVSATLRDGDKVTPLELFFDLVFVLAITQCTALMADEPTARGITKGILALAVLWWAWVGYAWLTSVVDPEEGAVRLAIFAAMASMLVVALCLPSAFDDLGLVFAVAYGIVRAGQLLLFLLAARGDPVLRRSVLTGLVPSTALGISLLVAASFVHDALQGALWAAALSIDLLGPLLKGADGWRFVPHHFAERHGLVLIIALGESIVAIGVGAEAGVDAGVITAAVLGVGLAGAMWWLYFDVTALAAERHLTDIGPGAAQNRMARDAYSYLHFPMIAGIVLVALGLKSTIARVDEPLSAVQGFALAGGAALYLLAHVTFRVRIIRSVSRPRLLGAAALVVAVPFADEVDALVLLGAVAAVTVAVITYEVVSFAEGRHQVRHAEGS